MKILAIETATVAGSVAVVDDNKGLIGEIKVDVKIAHSERLMSSVEWLLRASGISIEEIDALAVSIGPGSFTGLRIGLSTAKGLSYATNKPIVPVPTIDAFAASLPFCSHLICPMLDARKNEVYAGLYKWEGTLLRKILPATAINPGKLLEQIRGPVVLMGDATVTYKQLIADILKTNAIFAPPSKMSPSASTGAETAIEKINQGTITDPISLTPFYIRKSEAEIRWKG